MPSHTDGSVVFARWHQCDPTKTCFSVSIRVHIPNGISIGSAVFAGFVVVTDRQTDHATIGHIYVVLLCGLTTTTTNSSGMSRES